MSNVVVVDYGTSNLRSVAKALEHVAEGNHQVSIGDQAEHILAADRVVFPGQGAIGQCMERLKSTGLDRVIRECIQTRPFLGICLGLQSLMDKSDEDNGTDCLGVIPGGVTRFQTQSEHNTNHFKIPHMGWNNVNQKIRHPLWKDIADGSRFYFVHSYYVKPEHENDIAATTDYITSFTSAVARGNIFATQFHPEKSQQAGLTLLRNFLTWDGNF